MPKISKVRIVNFSYNDSKRLIADELFSFENRQQQKALNVLLNLANGGGKSVLVQLMMQPLVPKAKVAGRRIEDFFTKSTEHCFVLLEWLKDNSDEKLLTGIALCASADSDEEAVRGTKVRYYTFCTNYLSSQSRYSIINLPLSERVNSRFVPAAFEAVRKLSKTSNGELSCYSSDDNSKWAKRLKEYGLEQNEWKMIEKLNSVEGGLSKYFESFKKSSDLLNKIIIPTVDEQLNFGDSKDSSLSEMLVNYVKRYSSEKEFIKKKEDYSDFKDKLSDLEPLADSLWNRNNDLIKACAKLFGFKQALLTLKSNRENQITQSEEKVTQLNAQIGEVERERLAFDYYEALKVFEEKDAKFKEIELKKNQIDADYENTKLRRLLLDCAKTYQKIEEIKSESEGLRLAIEQKENNSEQSKEIAKYKYSCYVQVQKEIASVEEKQEQIKQSLALLTEDLDVKNQELENSIKENDKALAKLNNLDGSFATVAKSNDTLVSKLALRLNRQLDGFYDLENLQTLFSKSKEQQESCVKAIAETKNKIATLSATLTDLAVELNENTSQKKAKEAEKATYENQIQIFNLELEKIKKISEEYEVRLERLAGDLQNKVLETRAQQEDIKQDIAMYQEQIEAVNNNSLHIPTKFLEYLNSTAVNFITCESYLLSNRDKIDVKKLLLAHPSLAYSIVVSEDAKQRILSHRDNRWYPYLVPIVTYEQINKALDGQENLQDSLAFYEESYFSDFQSFAQTLKEKLHKLEQTRSSLIQKEEKLSTDLACIQSFEKDFGFDYQSQKQKEIDKVETQLKKIDSELNAIQLRRTKLIDQNNKLIQDQEKLEKQSQEYSSRIENFISLLENINQEKEIYDQWCIFDKKVKDLKSRCKLLGQQIADLKVQKQELAFKKQSTDDQLTKLNRIKGEVQTDTLTPIITEDINRLYATYSSLVDSLTTEVQELKRKLTLLCEQLSNLELELNNLTSLSNIQKSMYENLVYFQQEYLALRSEEYKLENEQKQITKTYDSAIVNKSKAEGSLETKKAKAEEKGEILEPSQIGSNFDFRIKEFRLAITELAKEITNLRQDKEDLIDSISKLDTELKEESIPEKIQIVEVSEDRQAQYKGLSSAYLSLKNETKNNHKLLSEKLSDYAIELKNSNTIIHNAIVQLQKMLNSESEGDVYFSLISAIDSFKLSTTKQINQIETDLEDFKNAQSDLLIHCCLQGKRVYEGLLQMSNSSLVSVYEGQKKKMMRFDIPTEIEEETAKARILNEIKQVTEELLPVLDDELELKKKANEKVSSKNLLRKYIGKEEITVDAFKIDQNPKNAGYRSWENTQVQNSGAEKFVVYFAVILSLMNYTRGDFLNRRNKRASSSLILDNPFGATSSKHILTPMFEIAKHFNVQMICLSDINKSDVISCFDTVIRLIIKKRQMSNNEVLTHEANDEIEHGFYRIEQKNLFD